MDLLNLDPQIALVEGQLWNLTHLVDHNIKVYGTDQLESTLSTTTTPRPDETIADNIGKVLTLTNVIWVKSFVGVFLMFR